MTGAASAHDAALTASAGTGWQMSSVKAGTLSSLAITGLAAIGRLASNTATTSSCAISGLCRRLGLCNCGEPCD